MRTKKPAFTLIELLVTTTLFTVVVTMASAAFSHFFKSVSKTTLNSNLYEEARFIMERIAKESRENTINYEEYWNKNPDNTSADITHYGTNYCSYQENFYTIDLDGNGEAETSDGTGFGKDRIANNTDDAIALKTYNQNAFYLINDRGTEQTILKLLPFKTNPNDVISSTGLTILKLVGKDWGTDHKKGDPNGTPRPDTGEGNNKIDTWICAEGFECAGKLASELTNSDFVFISPNYLSVKNLTFYVAPRKDPRKAFNDPDNAVQIQPHVTINLTVEPSEFQKSAIGGQFSEATIQTTVSSRAQSDIIMKCERW